MPPADVYLNNRFYLSFTQRELAEKFVDRARRLRKDGSLSPEPLAADDPEASFGAGQVWEIRQ